MSGVILTKSLALASVLVALQPSLANAQDAKEKAKVHFDKGVELYKNADYDAALVEFQAAYAAVPHFAVRYNVGICLYELHRYGDANLELAAYLDEGGDEVPGEKKVEVESILADLDSLLGTLKVECDVEGATLIIDDKPHLSWLVRLDVGEHEIEVQAPGHATFKAKIGVPGGEVVVVKADPEPETKAGKAKKAKKQKAKAAAAKAPPKKTVPKAAFWAMLGTTGALAITAAVTGTVALQTEKDYRKLGYEDDWKPLQEKADGLALATDVIWGVTGAAAICTVVLAAISDFSGKEKAKKPAGVGVALAPTWGGVVVEGEF